MANIMDPGVTLLTWIGSGSIVIYHCVVCDDMMI